MRTAEVYSVLIASPSDVTEFRDAARNALLNWSLKHGAQFGVFLAPVMWESDSAPQLGAAPQEILNETMVDRCDIAVALFGGSLGGGNTPESSGTVIEIDRMHKNGKLICVYFSHAPVDLWSQKRDAFDAVQNYYDSMKGKGMLGDFSSTTTLEENISNHMTIHFQRRAQTSLKNVAAPESAVESPAPETFVHESLLRWMNANELLRKGDYAEGMKILQAADAEDAPSEELLAVARLTAYRNGANAVPLDDLQRQAESNPKNSTVRRCYAHALTV